MPVYVCLGNSRQSESSEVRQRTSELAATTSWENARSTRPSRMEGDAVDLLCSLQTVRDTLHHTGDAVSHMAYTLFDTEDQCVLIVCNG
eukprot:scaffold133130_cov49-Prasinocladus_malaysianus.AAC.1